jgi:hypothetical protein
MVRLLHGGDVLAICVEEVVIIDIPPFAIGSPGQVERVECIPQRVMQASFPEFFSISPAGPWSIKVPDHVSVSLFVGSAAHVLRIPLARSAAVNIRTIPLPQTPHPEGSSVGHFRAFQCMEPKNPVFSLFAYPPEDCTASEDDSTSRHWGRLECAFPFPEDLGRFQVVFDERSGRVILEGPRPWNAKRSRSVSFSESLASYLGIDTLLVIGFA